MPTEAIVRVDCLKKKYGDTVAVDGVSLEICKGEIFGIVGPNGAGKTTTMDCITGLRKPDSGFISVLGMDPQRDSKALLERIGIQQQESELPDRMRVSEAMELFSSFYLSPADWSSVLDVLGLSGKRASHFSQLSGGQKKRLFVALSLVGNPEAVFLDELTSGLDPQARRSMWNLVRNLRDDGRTVFLSTHYMDEAEKLCDRVAIIDNGRIVAVNTPAELIRIHGFALKVVMGVPDDFRESLLNSIEGVSGAVRDGNRISAEVASSMGIMRIVGLLSEMKVDLGDFHTDRSTLEDVFLKLTGKEMRD